MDRAEELEHLLQQLVHPTQRLISVVGEGGVGKTRLALAAAQALASCFVDGIWFVPLVDVDGRTEATPTHHAISTAIATAFGLALNERQERQTQLLAFLRNKELLLVLDNFEHLLAGAGLIHTLLRAAPQVAILVTSRQPLNFQAEQVMRLVGLATPATGAVAAATTYPAVTLFDACARHAHPSFVFTAENVSAVVRICQIVRGLPLGIELAATWVNQFAPTEIATWLTEHRLAP